MNDQEFKTRLAALEAEVVKAEAVMDGHAVANRAGGEQYRWDQGWRDGLIWASDCMTGVWQELCVPVEMRGPPPLEPPALPETNASALDEASRKLAEQERTIRRQQFVIDTLVATVAARGPAL